jgi:hypothetical protein
MKVRINFVKLDCTELEKVLGYNILTILACFLEE